MLHVAKVKHNEQTKIFHLVTEYWTKIARAFDDDDGIGHFGPARSPSPTMPT